MTDKAFGSQPGLASDVLPRRGEKRPRTVYLLQRRYRMLSRLAAAVGGAIGIGLVAYSLVPALLAGERVPPMSFVIAAIIIGAMALVPYGLVEWRWRRRKADLQDY